MYYTIYKVTNLLDGKIYIGSHKTKKLDDNYMGSGIYIKRAINQHGVKNFRKEILFVFRTAEEMYVKEAEIVNENFLKTENTYNMTVGGFGGWDYANKKGLNNSTKSKETLMKGANSTRLKWKTDSEFRKKESENISERNSKVSKNRGVRQLVLEAKQIAKETNTKMPNGINFRTDEFLRKFIEKCKSY